jgi:two-component system CheB/CheR fusion protein
MPTCRVAAVNEAFLTTFGVTKDDSVGRGVFELGNGQWDIPALRTLLEAVLPERVSILNYLVTHTFERIGRRVMRVNARELRQSAIQPRMVLLAIDDVTAEEGTP